MQTALNIAKFFLSKVDEDAGDLISNLKLQKLLYYAQGFHLALYDEPLFAEEIKAWTHGPVIPDVYHHFKEYGDEAIPAPTKAPRFSREVTQFLNEVYKVYGQFSAWKLRNMTHGESPWKNAPSAGVISHDSLRTYFKTQLA